MVPAPISIGPAVRRPYMKRSATTAPQRQRASIRSMRGTAAAIHA